MIVRSLEPRDLGAVEVIHHLSHPTWPARIPFWWAAHPTLVLEEDENILGTTSFSISIATDRDFKTKGAEVAYGHGVSVHPEHRGRGLGFHLAEARHKAIRLLDITFFMGLTPPENMPMLAIFKKQGLTFHARLPKVYPDGQDGLMYVGGVR